MEGYEGRQDSKKFPQILTVLLVALGSFSIGTHLSWTSPALQLYNQPETIAVTDQEGSWICALLPLGAVCATLPTGFIVDFIGRKKTLWAITVPLLVSWIILCFAPSVIWVQSGRFLGGMACGACSVAIPMYVSEVAEASIRGSLGTIYQLQMALGILFAFATGFTNNLVAICMLCAIVPTFLLVAFAFLPESPAWLVMQGQHTAAAASLRRLRGKNYQTDQEIVRLQLGATVQGERARVSDLKHYKKATIITLVLMAVQQLSGVNTVIFYANKIFEESGHEVSSITCSVVVGIVQVIATYFSTMLIDRVGRKILLFISAAAMAICMLVLSGYFGYQESHNLSHVIWIPLLSFAVFIVVFSLGFGPIPWMMVGELFTSNVKSVASSLTAICNWTLAFTVIKGFQDMMDLVGIAVTFGIFGVILILGTVFVVVLVPETKGKTIEEVQIILYGESTVPA